VFFRSLSACGLFARVVTQQPGFDRRRGAPEAGLSLFIKAAICFSVIFGCRAIACLNLPTVSRPKPQKATIIIIIESQYRNLSGISV
jgi:hypothetical protein